MVRLKIYVEGGSPGNLASKSRKGFSEFFSKAGLEGNMPRVVACGSRDEAWGKFETALKTAGPNELPLLLVDSEDPVQAGNSSWLHLQSRDNWGRPDNAQEDQAHLMVQCMESWFLADVSELEWYFGPGFRTNAIPKRNDIERVPKADVFEQLESASRGSNRRAYSKGRHSFDILAQIDPEKVIQRSKPAKRLIDTLKGHLIPA